WVSTSGRTAVECSSSSMICPETAVCDSSTTNNQIRGSSSPEGVPPASRKVKIIGSTMKKSNSDQLPNRTMASFHAIAKIFFILNSLENRRGGSRQNYFCIIPLRLNKKTATRNRLEPIIS